MSFEPEFISGILNDALDEEVYEYDEHLYDKWVNLPLFSKALDIQKEYSEMRITKDYIAPIWSKSQESLGALDVAANEAELLGEFASLRGKGIEVPQLQVDLSKGAALATIDDLSVLDGNDAASMDKYLNSDDVNGQFFGFSLRFKQVDSDEYVPELVYQLAYAFRNVSFGQFRLFATGAVGEAQLYFNNEERIGATKSILDQLFSLCKGQEENISQLNFLLANSEKHDARTIRQISHRAEKIINALDPDIAPRAEDQIIKLASHFIEDGDEYYVKTTQFTHSILDKPAGVVYFGGKELHAISGSASGFIFMPDVVVNGREVEFIERRVFNMVIENESGQNFTPLTKVQEFTKI